jgi:2'-5' RNA ligase
MPFAVAALLDSSGDATIRGLLRALAERGALSPSESGLPPHLTFGVCEDLDVARFGPELAALAAEVPPLELSFESVGFFFAESGRGVAFLGPVVTADLLGCHERLHRLLERFGRSPWEHYLPGRWVPHCTLSEDLGPLALASALEVCRRARLPLRARAEQLTLVEFQPIKPLGTFELVGGRGGSRDRNSGGGSA